MNFLHEKKKLWDLRKHWAANGRGQGTPACKATRQGTCYRSGRESIKPAVRTCKDTWCGGECFKADAGAGEGGRVRLQVRWSCAAWARGHTAACPQVLLFGISGELEICCCLLHLPVHLVYSVQSVQVPLEHLLGPEENVFVILSFGAIKAILRTDIRIKLKRSQNL